MGTWQSRREVSYLDRIVEKIESQLPVQPKILRVAAYARVSSGKDAMLHSLSAQVSYYSDLIQNHPGWHYCGVFSDEALTGTKEDRSGFQKLLAECRAGDIDCEVDLTLRQEHGHVAGDGAGAEGPGRGCLLRGAEYPHHECGR